MDDDESGQLSFNEFRKGINDYGLHLEPNDVKTLFDEFDEDGSGSIDFNEFIAKLRPPMSKVRRELIEQAYSKLDKTGIFKESYYCKYISAAFLLTYYWPEDQAVLVTKK